MRLVNTTPNKVISDNLIEAKGLIGKSLGLHKYQHAQSLQIRTRFGIHTLFLKQPIDVLVLNNKLEVVKLKENLKPNRIFLWNPKFNTVIELPQTIIAQTGTQIGDMLSIEE